MRFASGPALLDRATPSPLRPVRHEAVPMIGRAGISRVGSNGQRFAGALQARAGNAAMQRLITPAIASSPVVQRACACGGGCGCDSENSEETSVQRATFVDEEETSDASGGPSEADTAAPVVDTVDGGATGEGGDGDGGATDVAAATTGLVDGDGAGDATSEGAANALADVSENVGDQLGGFLGRGGGGAPAAPKKACTDTKGCPDSFCAPLGGSKADARAARNVRRGILLAGIGAAVDSKVLPLWDDYLGSGSADGGDASVRDLSPTFQADFRSSKTTQKTTDFLTGELRKKMLARPPAASPDGITLVTEDIAARITGEMNAIDTPGVKDEMDFDQPGEAAGNLCGGIGKDQLSCPSGAQPSSQDDARKVSGQAIISDLGAGRRQVSVLYDYEIRDTIDLCPGNCGAIAEMIATIPMSRFEASGISGDIPFVVRFTIARQFTLPRPRPSP